MPGSANPSAIGFDSQSPTIGPIPSLSIKRCKRSRRYRALFSRLRLRPHLHHRHRPRHLRNRRRLDLPSHRRRPIRRPQTARGHRRSHGRRQAASRAQGRPGHRARSGSRRAGHPARHQERHQERQVVRTGQAGARLIPEEEAGAAKAPPRPERWSRRSRSCCSSGWLRGWEYRSVGSCGSRPR